MKLRYIAISSNGIITKCMDYNFFIRLHANVKFIDNYLSKAVRKLKIETNYNMIDVNLEPTDNFCRIEMNVLLCYMKYTEKDMQELLSIHDEFARYDYYLSLLEKGYKMAIATGFDVPLKELLTLHDEFRNNGYRNEWVWKERQIKAIGVKLSFKCYFTTSQFHLDLDVYKLPKRELLTSGVVFRTPPYEVCYDKKFRKLVVNEDTIEILDFLDHPSFSISISKLLEGKIEVKNFARTQEELEDYERELKSLVW